MSSLQVDNIQSYNANPPVIKSSSGAEVGTFCRAWVNFNGTGTVAIRASFNVSSITDNGTGDYTVNFTTAMVDANYSAVASGGGNFIDVRLAYLNASYSTTAHRFSITNNSTAVDATFVNVAIFR